MPKRVDMEAQRRAIATAAIAVIGGAGLEGARLRDVAKAARVTTGAVTHYFDGKEAVLEAALAEIVRRTLARMESGRGQDRATDVAAFIARVGSYLPLDDAARREWRVWLAFWGRAIADERLRAIHRDYYAAFAARLVRPLQVLRRPGAPPPPPARLRRLADAVIAAIDGIGIRATLEPAAWPPKRQRETLRALLLPLLAGFSVGRDD